MPWTIKRNAEGEYECCDPAGNWRALIRKRERSARPWCVHRVTNGVVCGADSFKTLSAAKEFVTNNPAVWGA